MGARITGLDEALQGLKDFEFSDAQVEKALTAAADVALPVIKSNLKLAVGSDSKSERAGESTGELVSALGISPVKLSKRDIFSVKIGFREPRKGGESNAKVANILEYGRRKSKNSSYQKPRPWLAPSVRTVEKKVDKVIHDSLSNN